jgi:hypothetical protein
MLIDKQPHHNLKIGGVCFMYAGNIFEHLRMVLKSAL